MPQQTEATNGSANGAAAPPGQAQGAAAKSAAAPPSNRAKAPPTPLPELPEPGTFCASMWQGVEGIFRWGGGAFGRGRSSAAGPSPARPRRLLNHVPALPAHAPRPHAPHPPSERSAILAHPFLRGLADGSLDEGTFRHYVVQDALYLRWVPAPAFAAALVF